MDKTDKELIDELKLIKKGDEYYKKYTDKLFAFTSFVIGISALFVTAAAIILVPKELSLDSKIKEVNQHLQAVEDETKTAQYLINAMLSPTYATRMSSFDSAIKNSPDNPTLYYFRALATLNSNNTDFYKSALNDCNKAIELNSNYYDAYFLRGQILLGEKDYQKACDDFILCIAHINELDHDISNGELYYFAGIAYYNLNNYPKAVEHFSKLSDEQKKLFFSIGTPIENSFYYQVAKSYEEIDNYTEATKYYKLLLARCVNMNDNIHICQKIIDLYAMSGNNDNIDYYRYILDYIQEHGDKPLTYDPTK